MRSRSTRLAHLLAVGAAALTVGATSVAHAGATTAPSPAAGAAAPASSTSTRLCAPAPAGRRQCLGLRLRAQANRPLVSRPGGVEAPGGGYAPADIQAAYGLASSVGSRGAGQTIALVEAFHDPNASADLAAYRSFFGLPACTAASGCFRQVDLGTGAADPTGGWESETALDMDAASATCPRCQILLVEAANDQDASLVAAIQDASGLGASVLNLSFGGCESGSGPYDSALQSANIPITVSSGDDGYIAADNNDGCAFGTPQYPASSPYVTAVGGTSLNQTAQASRGWVETAWQYSNHQGGGSGCSSFERKPSWQTDRGCARRTVADVSADGDPRTGLSVYDSYALPAGSSAWGEYGGTSLSAPLIAGIYALAGSPTAAVDGHVWYLSAAVNDVTTGSNAARATDCPAAYLCNAQAGFDAPTGAGTPAGVPLIDPTMAPLVTPATSTAIPLSWSPPTNIVPVSYQVWEQDLTTGAGWMPYVSTPGSSATFYGFRGHQYQFAVQYVTASGSSNGRPATAAAGTTIAPSATQATPFVGMYAVDGFGALHPGSSPPLPATASFTWDIVRGLAQSPSGEGGVMLDGWGGLHPFGDSSSVSGSAYWQGWDIARGIAALPSSPSQSGQWTGYVLDGWGGLRPFAVNGAAQPAPASGNAYWRGWSIARGVATFADGSGGVVLDGLGGVHPFAVGSHPQPAGAVVSGYWSNWDIARSLVLLPGSTSAAYQGYVLDGWGGIHPFASLGTAMPPSISTPFYASGWDIARAIVLAPASSSAGYVVEGYGGFHAFGGAPDVVTPNYGINRPSVHGAAAA